MGVGAPGGPSSSRQTPIPVAATTPEDEELIATVDAMIPDLFLRSLSGSFREGTVRCLLDLTETYPDRPAGMYDIARGQCRSLSEDPRRKRQLDMPTASSSAKSISPLETIYEDELGEAVPTTHALFLPKDETLPSAPFPVPGKSGMPDAVTLTSASSATAPSETIT